MHIVETESVALQAAREERDALSESIRAEQRRLAENDAETRTLRESLSEHIEKLTDASPGIADTFVKWHSASQEAERLRQEHRDKAKGHAECRARLCAARKTIEEHQAETCNSNVVIGDGWNANDGAQQLWRASHGQRLARCRAQASELGEEVRSVCRSVAQASTCRTSPPREGSAVPTPAVPAQSQVQCAPPQLVAQCSSSPAFDGATPLSFMGGAAWQASRQVAERCSSSDGVTSVAGHVSVVPLDAALPAAPCAAPCRGIPVAVEAIAARATPPDAMGRRQLLGTSSQNTPPLTGNLNGVAVAMAHHLPLALNALAAAGAMPIRGHVAQPNSSSLSPGPRPRP